MDGWEHPFLQYEMASHTLPYLLLGVNVLLFSPVQLLAPQALKSKNQLIPTAIFKYVPDKSAFKRFGYRKIRKGSAGCRMFRDRIQMTNHVKNAAELHI